MDEYTKNKQYYSGSNPYILHSVQHSLAMLCGGTVPPSPARRCRFVGCLLDWILTVRYRQRVPNISPGRWMTVFGVCFCLVKSPPFVVNYHHVPFYLLLPPSQPLFVNVVHIERSVAGGHESCNTVYRQDFGIHLVARPHVESRCHVGDLVHPVHYRITSIVCNVKLQALFHQRTSPQTRLDHGQGRSSVHDRLAPRVSVGWIGAAVVR